MPVFSAGIRAPKPATYLFVHPSSGGGGGFDRAPLRTRGSPFPFSFSFPRSRPRLQRKRMDRSGAARTPPPLAEHNRHRYSVTVTRIPTRIELASTMRTRIHGDVGPRRAAVIHELHSTSCMGDASGWVPVGGVGDGKLYYAMIYDAFLCYLCDTIAVRGSALLPPRTTHAAALPRGKEKILPAHDAPPCLSL